MATATATRPPLPPRQRELLEQIVRFKQEFGWPPTIRELAKLMGCSSNFGIQNQLDALEKKGWIKRDGQRKARTIVVLAKPWDVI